MTAVGVLVVAALLLLPVTASARNSRASWDDGGTHAHGTITPLAPIILNNLASGQGEPVAPLEMRPEGTPAAPPRAAGVPQFVDLGQLPGVGIPKGPVTLAAPAGQQPNAAPSDSQVAAGGGKVVELVNTTGGVYARDGTLVKQFALASLATPFAAVTDPRIVFDQTRGIFMISIQEATLNMGGNRIMVAVSATSDPLGTWFRYIVFTAPSNECIDQPKLGYSADKIVVTSHLFNAVCARGPAPFDSSRMLVLDAGPMRSNNPTTFDEFNMNSGLNHRMGLIPALPTRQAEQFGSTLNAFVVYHGSDILNSDIAALIVIRGNPSGSNVQFQEQSNGVDEIADPPLAAQPPGFPSINTDPGTERPLSAVLLTNNGNFGGRVAIVWGSKCRPTGDSFDRNCIRLVESQMNSSASSSSVLQDVALGLVGQDVFFPAVTAEANGDVFVTYTRTSVTSGPVDEVAGLGHLSPVKSTGRTILRSIAPVAGPVDGSNNVIWGDYSGIAPDDTADPDFVSVWATPSSTRNAGTVLGLVTLSKPLVTSVTPNRGNAGTLVTIAGRRFPKNAAVLFGTAPSSPVVWKGPEQIQATAPANPGGPVDVRVVGQKGISPIVQPDDVYSYPLTAWSSLNTLSEVRSFDVTNPGAPVVDGADVGVGNQPTSVAVTPDSRSVVVADSGGITVSVVNPVTRTATAVPAGGSPVDVAVTQDSKKAWIALASNMVEAVDLGTLQVIPQSKVGLPGVPDSIAVSDDGRYVFVTVPASGVLLVYDVSSGVPSLVNVASFNRPAKLAAGRGLMWVTIGTPPTPELLFPLLARPPFTVGNPLLVGVDPGGVAVTPAGDFIAVTNAGGSTVSIVNHANGPNLGGDTKFPDVNLDSGMLGVVSSPAADRFFIASHDFDRLIDAGPPPPLPLIGFAPAADTADVSMAVPIPRACNGNNLFQQPLVGAAPGQVKAGDPMVAVTRVLWCFDVRLGNGKAKFVLNPGQGSSCPVVKPSFDLVLDPGDNTILFPLSAPACAATYTVKVTLKDPNSNQSAQATTKLLVTS